MLRAQHERQALYGRRGERLINHIVHVQSAGLAARDKVGTFMGMQIVESPICLVREPVRKHVSKGRGSYMWKGGYCKRIQKKWAKRYGMHDVPAFFITCDSKVVCMHPSLVAKLKEEFDRGQSY